MEEEENRVNSEEGERGKREADLRRNSGGIVEGGIVEGGEETKIGGRRRI